MASKAQKKKTPKTPLINRSMVKRIAHANGVRVSQNFLSALDTVIVRQIERACSQAKGEEVRTLRGQWVTQLFM